MGSCVGLWEVGGDTWAIYSCLMGGLRLLMDGLWFSMYFFRRFVYILDILKVAYRRVVCTPKCSNDTGVRNLEGPITHIKEKLFKRTTGLVLCFLLFLCTLWVADYTSYLVNKKYEFIKNSWSI